MKNLFQEELAIFRQILLSIGLGILVGLPCGASSWLFLVCLEWATEMQATHSWLLYLLPFAGILIPLVYLQFEPSIEAGNNLILEEIHQPSANVPWRMAPLVATATVFSHLFGASTGREGTAVQMGGSLADWLARHIGMNEQNRRTMLVCGVSGGFGAVFGTPLAGMVFGMEVLSIGRMRYSTLLPCFISSVVGDQFCQFLGATHHDYRLALTFNLTFTTYLNILLLGILAGLTSLLFIEMTHFVSNQSKKRLGNSIFRPFLGGIMIIILTFVCGSKDYLGLSLPLIEQSFTSNPISSIAFLWKLIFTATSLGMGFKGGEVTPLFCMGAALGHAFAITNGMPVELFAAIGFVAVFAGAANTPLSCIIMGIELFGSNIAVPIAFGCILAYLASGHRSIYHSQRIDTAKNHELSFVLDMSIKDLNDHNKKPEK